MSAIENTENTINSKAIDIPTVSYSKVYEKMLRKFETTEYEDMTKGLLQQIEFHGQVQVDKPIFITIAPENTPEEEEMLRDHYNENKVIESQYEAMKQYEWPHDSLLEMYSPRYLNQVTYPEEGDEMMIFEMDGVDSSEESYTDSSSIDSESQDGTLSKQSNLKIPTNNFGSDWSRNSNTESMPDISNLNGRVPFVTNNSINDRNKYVKIIRNLILSTLFILLVFVLVCLSHMYNK